MDNFNSQWSVSRYTGKCMKWSSAIEHAQFKRLFIPHAKVRQRFNDPSDERSAATSKQHRPRATSALPVAKHHWQMVMCWSLGSFISDLCYTITMFLTAFASFEDWRWNKNLRLELWGAAMTSGVNPGSSANQCVGQEKVKGCKTSVLSLSSVFYLASSVFSSYLMLSINKLLHKTRIVILQINKQLYKACIALSWKLNLNFHIPFGTARHRIAEGTKWEFPVFFIHQIMTN